MVSLNAAMRATTCNLSRTSDGTSLSRPPSILTETSRQRIRVNDDGGNSSQNSTSGTQSNNEPEDIVQKSFATSHDLPPQQITNEFEIPQDEFRMEDTFKELLYSQHANIQESADTEEPNVPSIEGEEPTELVNAEVEFILERSTTESRDAPADAASLINRVLSTINKSTPFSSTMPPLPP
ncbi:hypothetical protein K3495_g3910 [Podosphaera aphanis]|nr:hypothetical protein K3495_g3910 [Podosphaera aphanis]